MIKIWTKIYKDDKITKNTMFTREEKFVKADFHKYVYDICAELDIPSPVILKTHIKNFTEFNIAKFKKTDFVETVYFDFMTLENC